MTSEDIWHNPTVRDLEAIAVFMEMLESKMDPEYDGYCKSYDPLEIELNSNGSGIAHSYVMDLEDGGRHHPFKSLTELREQMLGELQRRILHYDRS